MKRSFYKMLALVMAIQMMCAATPVVATRRLDSSISSSTEIYIAEVDVRFEDENSGVVEFYGGSNLGPTIIFDGTKIKTKTGNPSTYVTMYDNAKSGNWYNVKFVVNGKSSVYGYTTDIENGGTAQITKSDIKRNLRNANLSQINVTNQVNSFVNVTTPASDSAVIEVKYADDETAKVQAPETGGHTVTPVSLAEVNITL